MGATGIEPMTSTVQFVLHNPGGLLMVFGAYCSQFVPKF